MTWTGRKIPHAEVGRALVELSGHPLQSVGRGAPCGRWNEYAAGWCCATMSRFGLRESISAGSRVVGWAGPRPDWGGDGSEFPGGPHRKAVSRRHGLLITDRWMKQTADVETPKRLLDRDDLDSFKRRRDAVGRISPTSGAIMSGLCVGEALEWMSRQILPTSRISPRSTTRWRTARALLFRVARRNGGASFSAPRIRRAKQETCSVFVRFRPQFIFSHCYSDDETQDVVGRLCAHDLGVLVIAFTND